jgi:hypothetical protein
VKIFTSVLVSVLACAAAADRFVYTPIAKPLGAGEVRTEYIFGSGSGADYAFFDTGLMMGLDATARMIDADSGSRSITGDLNYSIMVPFSDMAPGIAVGVQDLMDETEIGRRAYLAATFRFSNDGENNQDTPTEVTLGFWNANSGAAFFNVRLPFAEQFRLIAEHDSKELIAGADFRPLPDLSVKWLFRSGAPQLGVSYHQRF